MKLRIELNPDSHIPKYQQIINSVIAAIDQNQVAVGDKIPSVGEVSDQTGLAKKTVVQAFEYLKQKGVISSVKYKGFYVASTATSSKHNLFLLFNRFAPYKEEIYNGIKNRLGDRGIVDIYFHNNNINAFNTLVEKSNGKYTAYVIMPIANEGIEEHIVKLPKDKVYILDTGYKEWGNRFPSVCQYFDEDIFVLSEGFAKIRKYNRIVMVTGQPFYNTEYSDQGFLKFCEAYVLKGEIKENSKGSVPLRGELYIVFDDNDLVDIIKKARFHGLEIGKDIGVISYNETPFKEVIGNGISTISTDFEKMGTTLVDMIVNREKKHIRNPCRLIDRGSF